jgi:hypothetical protein
LATPVALDGSHEVIANSSALPGCGAALRVRDAAGGTHMRAAGGICSFPAGYRFPGGESKLAPRQQGRNQQNQAK